MELNKDCARDILIYIREHCNFRETKYGKFWHEVSLDELCESKQCSKYGIEVIAYTINILTDYNLIKESTLKTGSKIDKHFNNLHINSLTSMGHEFIDNLLNDDIWNEVKTAIEKAKINDCSLKMYLKIYDVILKRLKE